MFRNSSLLSACYSPLLYIGLFHWILINLLVIQLAYNANKALITRPVPLNKNKQIPTRVSLMALVTLSLRYITILVE